MNITLCTTYIVYTYSHSTYIDIFKDIMFCFLLRVISKLGEGHFATVYFGVWRRRGIALQVAVKRLRSRGDSELRVKFLQEAATTAQFRHPHIVTVLGVVNTLNLSSPCVSWLVVQSNFLSEYLD